LAEDEPTSLTQLREKLQGSPFADAPIVPTSVVSGRGLEELKSTLAAVLSHTPPPRDIAKPRLSVDRAFTLRGIGTIVTGTLTGGPLRRGQAVVIQPSGRPARIRSLQNHNHDVEASGPGTRTALNLADADVRSENNPGGVGRGEVITLSEFGAASTTLDVTLEKSARLLDSKSSAARPLKDGALVRIHHGSGNFPARVLFIENGDLMPNQRLCAQLRFRSPVFAFAGDRFIIRDWSEQTTLGGGMVLDPDADRKRFRMSAYRTFLAERAQSPESASIFVRSQLARDGGRLRSSLLLKARFSAPEIDEASKSLVAAGQAISSGEWLVDKNWWEQLRQRATKAIETEHQAHPERSGLALSELRAALDQHLPAPEVFEVLIKDLCVIGFTQMGVAIRRASHRPALPPHLQSAGSKLRAALSAKPFEPPSRKELAPDPLTQQALRFLLQTGEAIDLGEEVVLLVEAFKRATDRIKNYLLDHKAATVSELRPVVGTSRRILVPLLERLDRDGVTLRQGDQRVLRRRSEK
jgi:selenocysteine-specific elongation factor